MVQLLVSKLLLSGLRVESMASDFKSCLWHLWKQPSVTTRHEGRASCSGQTAGECMCCYRTLTSHAVMTCGICKEAPREGLCPTSTPAHQPLRRTSWQWPQSTAEGVHELRWKRGGLSVSLNESSHREEIADPAEMDQLCLRLVKIRHREEEERQSLSFTSTTPMQFMPAGPFFCISRA